MYKAGDPTRRIACLQQLGTRRESEVAHATEKEDRCNDPRTDMGQPAQRRYRPEQSGNQQGSQETWLKGGTAVSLRDRSSMTPASAYGPVHVQSAQPREYRGREGSQRDHSNPFGRDLGASALYLPIR